MIIQQNNEKSNLIKIIKILQFKLVDIWNYEFFE
jgi:hypothetical protein